MQRKVLLNVCLLLVLFSALSVAPASSRPAILAQQAEPQVAPAAMQVNVGLSFSYQGYLEDSNGPVNDQCRFTFSLFDRLQAGNQVGSSQSIASVNVVRGAFAVVLNDANQFGDNAFNGQARWLEITVDCDRGPSTLSPRQELLAAPYAHSLRPGAVIAGNGPENSGLLSLVGGYQGLRILSTSDDGLLVDAAGDNGVRAVAANYGGFFNGGNGGVLAAALTAEGPDLVLGGFTDSDGVYHGEGRIATSPLSTSSSLFLQSNGNATIQLDADASGENASFALRDQHNDLLFVAQSNGNVGIGTESPPNRLSVRGENHQIAVIDEVNGKTWSLSTNPLNQGFGVYENGHDNRFFIAAGGNVGLGGNQLPANRLTVRDDDHQIAVIDGNDSDIMWTLSTVEFGQGGFGIYEDGDSSQLPPLFIENGGNVGIGTLNPAARLAVNGNIRAKEITVETGWSDFVFAEGYDLMSLEEVKAYIEEYGHLPDIPSSAEVEENGVQVGEVESRLLQKIEEMTLHLIAMDARLQELEQKNAQLSLLLAGTEHSPTPRKGE